MNLSKRMEAVVSFVPQKSFGIADVGCDHAYVSIALVERGIASKVIAMDVRQGPLEIAKKNVKESGLQNEIELRLSDGLEKLVPGEVDTIIIAGMGGLLMKGILERGRHMFVHPMPTLILQPQSDISVVRSYLLERGYTIEDENMLIDEGKFYTVIKAKPVLLDNPVTVYDAVELEYGKCNLEHKSPVFIQYLQKEQNTLEKIFVSITSKTKNQEEDLLDKTMIRYKEIKQKIEQNREACRRCKEV